MKTNFGLNNRFDRAYVHHRGTDCGQSGRLGRRHPLSTAQQVPIIKANEPSSTHFVCYNKSYIITNNNIKQETGRSKGRRWRGERSAPRHARTERRTAEQPSRDTRLTLINPSKKLSRHRRKGSVYKLNVFSLTTPSFGLYVCLRP